MLVIDETTVASFEPIISVYQDMVFVHEPGRMIFMSQRQLDVLIRHQQETLYVTPDLKQWKAMHLKDGEKKSGLLTRLLDGPQVKVKIILECCGEFDSLGTLKQFLDEISQDPVVREELALPRSLQSCGSFSDILHVFDSESVFTTRKSM